MVEMQTLEDHPAYQEMITAAEKLMISACYISHHFFPGEPYAAKFSDRIIGLPAPIVPDEVKQKFVEAKMPMLSAIPNVDSTLLREELVRSIFLNAITTNYGVKEYCYRMLASTDKRALNCTDETKKAELNEKASAALAQFSAHHYKEPDSFDSKCLIEIAAISAARNMLKGGNNEMALTQIFNNVEDLVTDVANACHKLSASIIEHVKVA
jgi:hypothetical protein